MARKPAGDLGVMTISKRKAADAVPFGTDAAQTPQARTIGAKSLTVKVDGDLYAELLDYCHEQQKATGSKLTHQQVMVEGLRRVLADWRTSR